MSTVSRKLLGPSRSGFSHFRIQAAHEIVKFSSVADPGFLSPISDPTFFHPGSRIRLFFIPDPNFFLPGSRIHIKELKYFNPKIVFKLSQIWSGLFFPDPDPNFLPIPDPGSRGQKCTGSGSATLKFSLRKCRYCSANQSVNQFSGSVTFWNVSGSESRSFL